MRLFLFTFSCAAAILLAGCSDDTNSVGNKLIKSNEKYIIADTTFQAVADTAFNVSSLNGYGSFTVAGKTADMEAKAWLRFIPATVLPDSLKSCTIDTVLLHLTLGYTWNATAFPAEFEVREAVGTWTEAGATRDSLSLMTIGSTVLGRISDSLLVNRLIDVTLDSTVIRRWFTFINDATAPAMNGFVIQAKPGTSPGALGYYSYTSAANYPTLVVHYSGANGVRDSLTFSVSEDTFIASAAVNTDRNLEVRGGVSTWTRIRFDVSSLSQAAIINNATLELTQSSAPGATILGAGTPDSIYAYLGRNGGDVTTIDSTFRLMGKRKDNTSTIDPVYAFIVTPYIQYLISAGSPYNGIVIHSAYNNASVDHRTFYSSKAPDVTKRPRLLVTSSKQ